MVRKLKFHERKLLKKVDFITWKSDENLAAVKNIRKYYIQKREDYNIYHKIVKAILRLTLKIRDLPARSSFRADVTDQLLEKLYTMGVIPTKKRLEECVRVSVGSFCRRRLPVVMVKLRMAQHLKHAVQFIEQGHVRVGPEVVSDPAFLVTRSFEDFVTWTNTSKIKKHVLEYRDEKDDYDMM